jgi:hypothetical protein
MRKYLAAAALGVALLAGQAAASESAVADSMSDNIPPAWNGHDINWLYPLGILLIGVAAWGFSQSGHGHPASP